MTMDAETTAAARSTARARPKYLDIMRIRQPVPAIASILHRISGFGLFIAIPFLLCALQLSLKSAEAYRELISNPLVKLLLIGLAWALFHHLFAGIRFLLLDVQLGLQLERARASAFIAIVAAIVCALALGVWLW
jgi:succinate dehydrogenase / fumarate reductase cytochrome b subunit